MKCYTCNVDVEPKSYPEGECPSCGVTYTLPDSSFPNCKKCGTVGSEVCLDCLIE